MARPSRRLLLFISLLLWISCDAETPGQPGKNRAPTARISGAQAIQEGTFIAFDASGSTDPDGDTLTYAWDFGDGQKRTGGLAPHAYRDDGSYQVSLIVTDDRGASDTAHATISVSNAAPVISGLVTPPAAVRLGTPATIQFVFSDPGAADVLIGSIDFGDQTSSLVTSGTITHTYAAAGNYIVKASVRDDDGAVTEQTAATAIAIVPNPRPIAQISGPLTAREGANVGFSARGSADPDGDVVTYTWLPGDGRVYGPPHAGNIEQGWSYPDNGTYIVSVIVTDQLGAADTASTTLTVLNAAPVVSGVFPPTQQAAGIPAPAHVSYSDSGAADSHVIIVMWGDGTSDSVSAAAGGYSNSLIHIYDAPGSYSVTATVRDKDGAAGSRTASARVFDASQRKTVAGYDVFDLGTLGGNATWPRDFNDYGQVVGSSLTASGTLHAFLWDNGSLRDLGTSGYARSEAQLINNAGLIAGWVRSGDYGNSPIAATWENGTARVWDDVRTEYGTHVAALNESGVIAWNAHGHEDPNGWVSRGAAWERMGGLLHPMAMSYAESINERGQVVGGSAAVSTGESPWPYQHAFLWENGSMRDLGLLEFRPCPTHPERNCGRAGATSINESGQVVGFSTAADGSYHAVLWENSTVRDLWATPAGNYWANVLINDAGQAAGSAGGQGFFWSDGVVHPLGSLGGGMVEVVDMNEAGTVVGTSMTANGEQHAFVWTRAEGMVDLGTGPHGFNRANVIGISFRGDIVGSTEQCNSENCYQSLPRAVMWRRP